MPSFRITESGTRPRNLDFENVSHLTIQSAQLWHLGATLLVYQEFDTAHHQHVLVVIKFISYGCNIFVISVK